MPGLIKGSREGEATFLLHGPVTGHHSHLVSSGTGPALPLLLLSQPPEDNHAAILGTLHQSLKKPGGLDQEGVSIASLAYHIC